MISRMNCKIFVLTFFILLGTSLSQEKTGLNPTQLHDGREMLRKAVAAAGGFEKFQALENFSIKTRHVLYQSTTQTELIVVETALLPDKTKQVMTVSAGERVQVLNDKNSWKKMGTVYSDLIEAEKREMKRGLFLTTFNLFKLSASAELEVQYYGQETLGGKTNHVLHITNKSGDFLNLYVSAETYLVAKKTYSGAAEVGLATLEETYSDYRDIQGIKMPFHTIIKANGRPFMETSVVEAKLNVTLPEDFFWKN